MSQTFRTYTELMGTTLADNSSLGISEQDLRDAIYSTMAKQQVVVSGDGSVGPYTVNSIVGFLISSTEVFVDGRAYARDVSVILGYTEATDGLSITFNNPVDSGAEILVKFYS